VNCGLRYNSISLLVVGTLHGNNTHSLQEVKVGLHRIIYKYFVTGDVGVVECVFLSFLTWLTIPKLLMAIKTKLTLNNFVILRKLNMP